LQKTGQVHDISTVVKKQNNAKGTCQVCAEENNVSSYDKNEKSEKISVNPLYQRNQRANQ